MSSIYKGGFLRLREPTNQGAQTDLWWVSLRFAGPTAP